MVVHGFTGGPQSIRPLAEALAEAGVCVELIRLPGHGTHWRDLASKSYEDLRRAVEGALSELCGRCDRVFLVGLSIGGTISLDVAARRPADVSGVVCINATILPRQGILARLAPIIAKLTPVLPARLAGIRPNDAARPGVEAGSYSLMSTAAAQSLLDAIPGVQEGLSGLTVPILAVYSAMDHNTPNKNTRAIPAAVGPEGDVRLVCLPNSYHLAPLDLDRAQLEAEVLSFIDREAPAP